MELKPVKMILAVVLLCSGFVHFTFESRLRIFSVSEKEISWEDSEIFCSDKNESLVTVYDGDDINFIIKFANGFGVGNGLYVGLHWTNRSVTWSDGTPSIFNLSTANEVNGTLVCLSIEKGNWTKFNCSERKHFMCYDDNNRYHLIDKEKNWCQAQLYCRTHYTDLVNITNEEQNNTIIEKGRNESFWIGLMYDGWEWADKGCSTYRNDLSGNYRHHKCTRLEPTLRTAQCEDPITCDPIVCSKGTVRIVLISKNQTWEEAFEYCEKYHSSLLQIEDDEDRKSVEQWLNYTKGNETEVTDNQNDLFWIALRQSRVFGFWIWRDRTVNSSNHRWKDGRIPEMPWSNNCGAINRTDFTWTDEDCLRELPSLCEEEIFLPKE